MQADIDRVLVDRTSIATRVREVAEQIIADLAAERRHRVTPRLDSDEPPLGEPAAQTPSPDQPPETQTATSGGESGGVPATPTETDRPGESGEPTAPSARALETHHEAVARITLVPILTGSIIFLADLIRHLPLYMQIKVMSVSSYPGQATTSQGVRIRSELEDLPEDLSARHVLVIDDILDSGRTLRAVSDRLRARRPASVRTCVLLRKQRPEAFAFAVDYVCFDIPDEFVVGYGLDFNGYYRNLPEIVTLKPEVVHA